MTHNEIILVARYTLGLAVETLEHPRASELPENLWRDQLAECAETLEQLATLDKPSRPAIRMATYTAQELRQRLADDSPELAVAPVDYEGDTWWVRLASAATWIGRTLGHLTSEREPLPTWLTNRQAA